MTLPLFLAFVLAALAAVLVVLIHEVRVLRTLVVRLADVQGRAAAVAIHAQEDREGAAVIREALGRAREMGAANDLDPEPVPPSSPRSTILPPRHDPWGGQSA